MSEISRDRMTVPGFMARKGSENRLSVLTCYEHLTARIFEAAGIDALLVGDSLGTVVQGKSTTVGVRLEHIIYHTEIVSRSVQHPLVIADLPFLTYQASTADAVRNAGRLMQDGGAHAVKLEGGRRILDSVQAIVRADIPVMGHLGLTPQSIHRLGNYRVQRDERAILDDAKALVDAGVFGIVLETIPTDLARKVTEAVPVPTIGIGAGPHCDGQVLVWPDAMGMTADFKAKFVKRYADLHTILLDAARQFREEVSSGTFPDAAHSYK